jgi:CrcB protein
MDTVWIGIGGAIGSIARYWTGIWTARLLGVAFPWGTLAVNVVGSFIIGFVATLTLAEGPLPASATMRAFIMAGFCGGYTTFSAFSLQSWDLMRAGEWMAAGANVVGSVVLCLAMVAAGHWLALRMGMVR